MFSSMTGERPLERVPYPPWPPTSLHKSQSVEGITICLITCANVLHIVYVGVRHGHRVARLAPSKGSGEDVAEGPVVGTGKAHALSRALVDRDFGVT